MLNSLGNRILLLSLLLLSFLMVGIGIWLYQSFYAAQLQGVQETLRVYSYSLLGSAERVDGRMHLPEFLPEGRFNTPGSGLLAVLTDYRNEPLWTSYSAQSMPLPQTVAVAVGEQRFSVATLNNENYMLLRSGIRWGEAGQDQYILTLAQNLGTVQQQAEEYRNILIAVLLVSGLVLLFLQWLTPRWGLAPLRRVAQQLKLIHQGQLDHISGNYPRELKPLTSNLNLLLKNEQAQRERYRHQMADLSHSLKTPLAVISGLLDEGLCDEQAIAEIRVQTSIMNERIRYQLQRAQQQSSALSIRQTEVQPLLESLRNAMNKVYAGQQVSIGLSCAGVVFQGDKQDLMEIAGNLLDNACKYGHGQVLVSAQRMTEPDDGSWALCVEDNGDGIAEDQRQRILQRGVRLDSLLPGQGIGLALVSGLVAHYQGSIRVEDSDLGGTCFRVIFPSGDQNMTSPAQ